MGVVQLWRMLLARRLLVLVLVVMGALLGALAAKLVPNQYQSRSRLVLNVLKPDPVTGTTVPTRALETFVQAQIELIRDYRVSGSVVDALGWERDPRLRQQYLNRKGDRQLDFRSWLAKKVSENTLAYLIPSSPILEIAYTSPSPDMARRGADAVREAFVAQTIQMRRDTAARNAKWFQTQTAKLKESLAQAQARKSAFERENGILLQDDETDTETAKLRAMASSAAVPPPVSIGATGPISTPSMAQLASVDAQLATARRTLGPNHPDIMALQQQRAALSAAAGREAAAARAAGRVSSGPSISNMISAQTQKVLSQRGLVGQAQRLAGEVTVLRDQVNKTAQSAADFELQAQSTESGFEPLGAAVTPREPISIGLVLFVLGGAAFGAGLGIALAILLELIFRRVRGPEDLYLDGLPVIGEMSRAPQGGSPGLLNWIGLKKSEPASA